MRPLLLTRRDNWVTLVCSKQEGKGAGKAQEWCRKGAGKVFFFFYRLEPRVIVSLEEGSEGVEGESRLAHVTEVLPDAQLSRRRDGRRGCSSSASG